MYSKIAARSQGENIWITRSFNAEIPLGVDGLPLFGRVILLLEKHHENSSPGLQRISANRF